MYINLKRPLSLQCSWGPCQMAGQQVKQSCARSMHPATSLSHYKSGNCLNASYAYSSLLSVLALCKQWFSNYDLRSIFTLDSVWKSLVVSWPSLWLTIFTRNFCSLWKSILLKMLIDKVRWFVVLKGTEELLRSQNKNIPKSCFHESAPHYSLFGISMTVKSRSVFFFPLADPNGRFISVRLLDSWAAIQCLLTV